MLLGSLISSKCEEVLKLHFDIALSVEEKIVRKNKLMINENFFNVHDYIVRKLIDNYLSS